MNQVFFHIAMKPSSSCSILSITSGLPSSPRSPSSRRSNSIGVVQAVTLCAVSAAFAAMSTALLCIVFLDGKSTDSLLQGRARELTGYGAYQLDAPRNNQAQFKSTAKEVTPVLHPLNYDRYHRRTISVNKKRALSVGAGDSTPEGVAWLMSFPNSGTSYTIHAVRELTNTTTATNYGLEGEIKDQESKPAFEKMKDAQNGPFLELIPERHTSPPKLFLTKTHCGGFCSSCMAPESFVVTPRGFLRSCLKGKRGVYSNDSQMMTTVDVRYSPDLVKKIVHILRNPLDNVVARFHLDRQVRARKHSDWLDTFPNNIEGFQRWCGYLNDNATQTLYSNHWVDSSLAESMKDVPCLPEFYRYVQWHNLAFAVTADLQVPSFVFHYEDYSNRFEEVTNDLTDFLGLDQVGEAPQFIDNKKYDDYYTAQQKQAIAIFIKEFATKPTWQSIAHYVDVSSVELLE